MTSPTVRVELGPRSYDIAITSDALPELGPFARQRSHGSLALVVTDEHVRTHADAVTASLHRAGFRAEQVVLPFGEAQKCLATAAQLYDRLVELHADRKTLIVAVGGGVIGDLAG